MRNLSALVLLMLLIGLTSAGSLPSTKKDQSSSDVSSPSNSSTVAVETSRQSDLEHNPLRIGFEPFYKFTNMFIDNTMHFDIPEKFVDLFLNMTKSEKMPANLNAVFNELKSYYDINDNLKFITYLPFKISTNFSILVIICILFIIAVPIAGLFLCMCRLCLRTKFNPYDRKNDSAKRKFLATVVFCLMVLLLLSTVILFFTNQNANNAIQKSPNMIRSSFLKMKNLATEDTPSYLEELVQNLENAKSNTTILIKNFTVKINEDIKKNIFSDITLILNETNEIVQSTSNVLADMNNEADSFNQVFGRFRTEILKSATPEIKAEINKIAANFKVDFNVNATEAQKVLGEIMKRPDETLSSILQALADNIDTSEIDDAIDSKIDTIQMFIQELKSNETSEKIDRGQNLAQLVKYTAHAYEHIYYALMGVCVFMLLWFILYTMGLAGLCARRANDTYSQVFHRGVSANLLMTGTSFFFIFASILMAVCIVLYTPGILMRQYIAKPLMNPDSNPSVKAAILPALENTNLTSFLSQCRQKKPILSISEADEIFKQITQVDIANLTSSGLLKPFIDKKREQLQLNLKPVSIENSEVDQIINDLLSTFNKIKADNLIKEAEKVKTDMEGLSQLALDFTKDADSLKKVWDEFNTHMERLVDKLRGLKGWQKTKNMEINQLKNKIETLLAQYNNQKEFNRLFTKTVNKTLEEEVLPNLNSVLSDILLIQKSPSCAPLAQIYDDLVTSFCFEFLDNFNTYWFFLLLSLGVHMIVLGFAISLADLLRKFYAYDEVLTEDIVMDDAKPYDGYSDHHLKEGYSNVKTSSYH